MVPREADKTFLTIANNRLRLKNVSQVLSNKDSLYLWKKKYNLISIQATKIIDVGNKLLRDIVIFDRFIIEKRELFEKCGYQHIVLTLLT